jgi:hypothetical protein
MNRLTLGYIIAAGLAIPAVGQAQTLYTCGDGTVRSVQAVAEAPAPPASADADATDRPGRVPEAAAAAGHAAYLVTVRLNNVVYTGKSSAGVPWNLDPTVLALDKEIYICANDQQMVLDPHDGTDYRANIVRARRESTVNAASTGR